MNSPEGNHIDGIISVYKEKGYTSHDVVAKMRGIFKTRKAGHTGTLDPDAEGVLPVCLGRATKLCAYLTDCSKTYRAVLLLGIVTDTQDAGGKILRQSPVEVSEQEVREAVRKYIGDYEQVPPMYSALKVNGKKLVDLARKGIVVERKSRRVIINDIRIESLDLPRVTMTVDCSRGTYIRTLCHDIGNDLLCGGCMESLIRTRVGKFNLENSHRLSELEEAVLSGKAGSLPVSMEECLLDYPAVHANPEADRFLHNGNPVEKELLRDYAENPGVMVRMYDSTGILIGLYQETEGGICKIVKMFYERGQKN